MQPNDDRMKYPFNNFNTEYREEDFSDRKRMTLQMYHRDFPTIINFTFSVYKENISNADRTEIFMLAMQEIGAWLLHGVASEITGAYDLEKEKWYILDENNNRLYESDRRLIEY